MPSFLAHQFAAHAEACQDCVTQLPCVTHYTEGWCPRAQKLWQAYLQSRKARRRTRQKET
jgi:hypothetical protein